MSYEVKEVVAKIKEKREEMKLSYKDLEKKTQISASTLYRYETMETSIPIDKFQTICKVLNLNAAELLKSNKPKIVKKPKDELDDDFKLAARDYKKLPEDKQKLFKSMMKSFLDNLKD